MPHHHVTPTAVAKVLPNDWRCRFNGHGLRLVTEVRRPREYAGGEHVDVKVLHGMNIFKYCSTSRIASALLFG